MKHDELEEKIKEIFLEEYRKDIAVTWDKYIPSGKLGLTVSIADDGIRGEELESLKCLLRREYVLSQIDSNDYSVLTISFAPAPPINMNLNEACAIIFPIIIHSASGDCHDDVYRKWVESTVNLLDKFYPEDIFTGKSGDKGSLAIKVVRENLKVKK